VGSIHRNPEDERAGLSVPFSGHRTGTPLLMPIRARDAEMPQVSVVPAPEAEPEAISA
jgi:hypothetical protein